jgi:integrase
MSKKFTNTDLAKPVVAREKVSDAVCRGLYASITPTTGATFSFRYYDSVARKQATVMVGRFDAKRFTVEQARAKAYDLKSDVGQGVNVAARARVAVEQQRAEGLTFNEVADLYIDWLRVPVQKKHGMCPRRESWDRIGGPEVEGATPKYQGGYLKRARAAFGTKAIAEVTDDDVALLLNDIIDQSMLGLAANLRTTLFGLFKWAGQPGRKYVRANPCSNLGDRPEMLERDRAFSDAEITTFWHALDAIDVPAPRPVALAFKLMLSTGLRGGEVCGIQREWLGALDGGTPVVRIPASHTKQRRPNHHPLNRLAVEIVKELLAMSDAVTGPLFAAGPGGAPFKRHMLTDYLTDRGFNGFKPKNGKVRRPGLRSYLGFAQEWRPHDLRHTAATLLVRHGADEADATKLLDHAPSKEAGVAKITGRYINLQADERAKRKFPILEELDRLLRKVIDLPVVGQVAPLQIAA